MTQREITSEIAYRLFEHRGYVHGRAAEDWFTAEAILLLCAERMTSETPTQPRINSANEAGPNEHELRARLEAAVADEGRAAIASRLGYASPSSVGRLLRRKQALSKSQIDRIRAAFDSGRHARAA